MIFIHFLLYLCTYQAFAEISDLAEERIFPTFEKLPRKKRDTNKEETRIIFTAFNKPYKLRVSSDDTIYAKGFKIMSQGKDGKMHEVAEGKNLASIISGYDELDSDVQVSGYMTENNFSAIVSSPDADVHIEKSVNVYNAAKLLNATSKSGTSNDDPFKDMFYIPDSFVVMPKKSNLENPIEAEFPSGRTCDVTLVADYSMFQHMCTVEDPSPCVNEMLLHLAVANKYFRSEDFNNDGKTNDFGLAAKKIHFYMDEPLSKGAAVHTDFVASAYPPDTPDSYAQNMSYLNFEETKDVPMTTNCITFAFNFEQWGSVDGIGLFRSVCFAYGVTERNAMFDPISYNVGAITFSNSMDSYGRFFKTASIPTFIHEIGHIFGAVHDNLYAEDEECLPFRNPFVMNAFGLFEQSLLGYWQKNTNRFSPCSKRDITGHLERLQNLGMLFGEHCLHDSTPMEVGRSTNRVCGNGIIEPGEDCDCGSSYTCGVLDPANCCMRPDSDLGCELNTTLINSECAGSDPCCNAMSCRLSESGTPCNFQQVNPIYGINMECKNGPALCNGSSHCPALENLADGTPCRDLAFVCMNGYCNTTRCEYIGLKDCQPSVATCEMYCCEDCEMYDDDEKCKSIHEFGVPYQDDDEPIYLQSGALCKKSWGICVDTRDPPLRGEPPYPKECYVQIYPTMVENTTTNTTTNTTSASEKIYLFKAALFITGVLDLLKRYI